MINNPKIAVFACQYDEVGLGHCEPLDTSHFRISLKIEPLDSRP